MSIRRAIHELFSSAALYYEGEQYVQILPWEKFGELPPSHQTKLDAAKAVLGKKYCLWNKKPKTVVERKKRRVWK